MCCWTLNDRLWLANQNVQTGHTTLLATFLSDSSEPFLFVSSCSLWAPDWSYTSERGKMFWMCGCHHTFVGLYDHWAEHFLTWQQQVAGSALWVIRCKCDFLLWIYNVARSLKVTALFVLCVQRVMISVWCDKYWNLQSQNCSAWCRASIQLNAKYLLFWFDRHLGGDDTGVWKSSFVRATTDLVHIATKGWR